MSKELIDRQKSARAVISSIEQHAEKAGEALAARFKHVLKKGEAMPDVGLLLALFGRALARDNAAAVAADEAHEDEKADDEAPRKRRDAAAALVREACVHARDGVETVYGSGALKILGMTSPAPGAGDGAGLVRWAENVAGKLADGDVHLPPALKRGVSVDRKALAEGIVEHVGALKAALNDVERERRELETTQSVKSAAIEANDESFASAANITATVLRAAGMRDHADKVRPSARRPGRTESTDNEPTDDEKQPK